MESIYSNIRIDKVSVILTIIIIVNIISRDLLIVHKKGQIVEKFNGQQSLTIIAHFLPFEKLEPIILKNHYKRL